MCLQALIVFVLYVRCTAINPADPGIMSKFERDANRGDVGHDLTAKDISRKFDETGSHLQSSPSVASRTSTLAANSSVKGSVGDAQRTEAVRGKSCYNPLAIFCGLFVYEDCRRKEETDEQQGEREEALFCTLCNAEVLYYNCMLLCCQKLHLVPCIYISCAYVCSLILNYA